jgi:hypothetical protein
VPWWERVGGRQQPKAAATAPAPPRPEPATTPRRPGDEGQTAAPTPVPAPSPVPATSPPPRATSARPSAPVANWWEEVQRQRPSAAQQRQRPSAAQQRQRPSAAQQPPSPPPVVQPSRGPRSGVGVLALFAGLMLMAVGVGTAIAGLAGPGVACLVLGVVFLILGVRRLLSAARPGSRPPSGRP